MLALTLAACGSARPTFNPNQQGNNGTPRELQLADKLLIGTLKLENTPNAVDVNQAETLLPLWQLYKSLNASNTAATQETDSVIQQIQAAMTADQIKAIDGMKLTGRDIFTTMQEMGLAPQANAQGTPFPRGGFENGGSNGFGRPGGGQGFNPGGQNLNPQQIATAQARRTQGGFGSNRVPTVLLDALIKLLESKGAPTSTVTPTSTPTQTITSTPALSTETPIATPTP
ncbi:MAG: hypothetical protein HY258_09730 [Chloroflexi bacterium]|nr:hypothetical protein [Chloroflexota bacterium]